MKQLSTCAACDGFLPPLALRCPHCGKHDALRALGAAATTLATMGTLSSTLMACYGPACADADCIDRYEPDAAGFDVTVNPLDSGVDSATQDAGPTDGGTSSDAAPEDSGASDGG